MVENCYIDVSADTLKIPANISIRIALYNITGILEVIIAGAIFSQPLILVVLRTVKFNDKHCRSAIEINDVLPDDLLPLYCYRQSFEKVVPKMTLFGGHIISQGSGVGLQFFIVFLVLGNPFSLPLEGKVSAKLTDEV